LELTLDMEKLIPLAEQALEQQMPVEATLPICNVNRATGTILGSEVTRRYGAAGLPEDTIRLNFVGTAGQSLGAFIPKGITLHVEGDSNDYVGKGLSGGKIIVKPSEKASFAAEENVIIGNTAFYGATAGKAYINGMAGERFAVRNSGAQVVVEGTGDHGCEYMTGGRVVVLGKTGRNFAAGMSGGIAYVLDTDQSFVHHANLEMVLLERVEDAQEEQELRTMIEEHVKYTGSPLGQRILSNWAATLPQFVRVIPKDYKKMMEYIAKAEDQGLQGERALMAAFESSMRELVKA
jgi:glutamate synthase (ferredoxin)